MKKEQFLKHIPFTKKPVKCLGSVEKFSRQTI